MKKEFIKWSKRTTLRPIPNITNSDSALSKFVWILSISLFTIMLGEKIASVVIEYFKYKVVTKLSLESNSNCKFPTVTFRIINWLNFEKYKEELGLIQDLEDSLRHISQRNSREDFHTARNDFISSYLRYKRFRHKNLTDMLEEEIVLNSIVSCRFNNQPCDRNDFTLIKSDSDGAYLQFNSGKMKTKNGSWNHQIPFKLSNHFGKYTGLELELFIGFKETEAPLARERGAILFLHEPNEIVTTDEHGIFLSANNHYNLNVVRKRYTLLTYPFNKCLKDNLNQQEDDFISSTLNQSLISFRVKNRVLIEKTLNLTGNYSQKYCFELCYQERLINMCDCYD